MRLGFVHERGDVCPGHRLAVGCAEHGHFQQRAADRLHLHGRVVCPAATVTGTISATQPESLLVPKKT